MFLRSKNNGRSDGNEDPDGERVLGNYQGDAIREIEGSFGIHDDGSRPWPSRGHTGAFEGRNGGTQGFSNAGHGSTVNDYRTTGFKASNVVPTAGDNRPKNIAVNYFIKINHECN